MAALRWVGERRLFAESWDEVEELGLVVEMRLVVDCYYGVGGVALASPQSRQKVRSYQRVRQ